MWPNFRSQQVTESAVAVFSKATVRFALLPSPVFNTLEYFPADYTADCEEGLDSTFKYVPPDQGLENVDIVILTAHGADLSPLIWDIRQRIGPQALIVTWHWDNHLSHASNLRTAIAADFVFPSHKYIGAYLIAPTSVLGGHIPLCCAQWKRDEVGGYFEQSQDLPRSSKLLVNYVDYRFSWRSELLRRLIKRRWRRQMSS
jgi:hypothetical protein